MEPVSPVLPGSAPVESKIGASQDCYVTLPAFHTELTAISRWRLTDAEREYIASGGDLFIAQMDFCHQLQPILPLAMPEDDILATVLASEEYVVKGGPCGT